MYQKIGFNLIFHLLFSVNIIFSVTFLVVTGSESGCYHRNKHLEMILTVFWYCYLPSITIMNSLLIYLNELAKVIVLQCVT